MCFIWNSSDYYKEKRSLYIEEEEEAKVSDRLFLETEREIVTNNNDSRRREYMEFTGVYHRPSGRENPAGQRREEHRRCYGGISWFRYTLYIHSFITFGETENII